MNWSRNMSCFTLLVGTAIGCSVEPDAASESLSANGQALLEVQAAPADALCLRITTTGTYRTDRRQIPLITGEATQLTLQGLPIGDVVLVGEAFDVPCAKVTTGKAPKYASEAAYANLAEGLRPKIKLVLNLNGEADVG